MSFDFEERVQLMLDKVDRDIATHGMSVIGVFDEPPFSYTIGLWDKRWPELAICGMSARQAHAILTSAKISMEEGLIDPDEIVDGYESSYVARDYLARFQKIPYPRRPLNVARRYWDSDDFPAYQIVWPDKEGRFPGDKGYEYDESLQTLPTEEEQ